MAQNEMSDDMRKAVARVRKTLVETVDYYHPTIAVRNIILRQLNSALEAVLENMALTLEQQEEYSGMYADIKQKTWESMMQDIISVQAGTGKIVT